VLFPQVTAGSGAAASFRLSNDPGLYVKKGAFDRISLGERESAVPGREHAARHNGNELAYIDAALFDPGGFHGVRR
jgi:hypothetical protein